MTIEWKVESSPTTCGGGWAIYEGDRYVANSPSSALAHRIASAMNSQAAKIPVDSIKRPAQ